MSKSFDPHHIWLGVPLLLLGLIIWSISGCGKAPPATGPTVAEQLVQPAKGGEKKKDVVPAAETGDNPPASPIPSAKQPVSAVASPEVVAPESPPAAPSESQMPDAEANEAEEKPTVKQPSAPIEKKQQRLPVPNDAEQEKAMKLAGELYKDEYANAKKPEEKRALAKKILAYAEKEENAIDPVEAFVLFRLAQSMAVQAADGETAFQTIDAIAERYLVDALQMKSEVLEGSAKKARTPAEHALLAEQSLEVIDDALAADKVPQATELGKLALAEASKARDKELLAKVRAHVQEVQSTAKAFADYEAAKTMLAQKPDDPDANQAAGEYLCFLKGDWQSGLPLMAKGSDADLKGLAKQEVASPPKEAAEQVKLADAWWDLAEGTKGRRKDAISLHAGTWYEQAKAALTGLVKAKVEKRLAEVAKITPQQAIGDTPSQPAAASKSITESQTPERSLSRGKRPLPAVAPFNEAQAKEHQKRWAKYLKVPVEQTNSIGMKLVLIPPGEFQMGSPKELIEEELRLHGDHSFNTDRLQGEGPQHRVRITKPYWLGVTEVTQEEYQRVMGSNPSKFQGDPKRPVEQVSWDDAVEFCRRLSELPREKTANRRYGLPTEAQWEYVCRAGSTGRWYFSPNPGPLPVGEGERLLGEYAWFSANAGGQTHPVGQKRANVWGLYDMYGNVWEWCQDWYNKNYYAYSPVDDPSESTTSQSRMYRGGSWGFDAGYCRSAYRFNHVPGIRNVDLGLRVMCNAAETSSAKADTGGQAASGTQMPSSNRTARLAEWENLKYGMFIHFNMFTFTGPGFGFAHVSPSTYAPSRLDVGQWIRVAKGAGMKYAVLTAKHDSGFCLWPSDVDDYNVKSGGSKIDVVGEFMKACNDEGIKPGLYYSIIDERNEGKVDWNSIVGEAYFKLIQQHITELHTRYPGIAEQWFDVAGKLSPQQRRELYELVKKLSPDCAVTMSGPFDPNGAQVLPGSFPTDVYSMQQRVPPLSRYNPVKEVGGKTYYLPLEVCDTLSKSWSWVPNDPPKSVNVLKKLYSESVGRGANLLLNVPPDKTGRIPDEYVRRLKELVEGGEKIPGTDSRTPPAVAPQRTPPVRSLPRGKAPSPAVAPFDKIQAKNHQKRWAKYLKLPVERTNSIGMKLVLIPPGEFDMGSTQEEVNRLLKEVAEQSLHPGYVGRIPTETPQHRVAISRPFYLGMYEVTQAEYQAVMGDNPSAFSSTDKYRDRVILLGPAKGSGTSKGVGGPAKGSGVVSIDKEAVFGMLLACHGEFVPLRAGWCTTCSIGAWDGCGYSARRPTLRRWNRCWKRPSSGRERGCLPIA